MGFPKNFVEMACSMHLKLCPKDPPMTKKPGTVGVRVKPERWPQEGCLRSLEMTGKIIGEDFKANGDHWVNVLVPNSSYRDDLPKLPECTSWYAADILDAPLIQPPPAPPPAPPSKGKGGRKRKRKAKA